MTRQPLTKREADILYTIAGEVMRGKGKYRRKYDGQRPIFRHVAHVLGLDIADVSRSYTSLVEKGWLKSDPWNIEKPYHLTMGVEEIRNTVYRYVEE